MFVLLFFLNKGFHSALIYYFCFVAAFLLKTINHKLCREKKLKIHSNVQSVSINRKTFENFILCQKIVSQISTRSVHKTFLHIRTIPGVSTRLEKE